jgi:hypothetical protein
VESLECPLPATRPVQRQPRPALTRSALHCCDLLSRIRISNAFVQRVAGHTYSCSSIMSVVDENTPPCPINISKARNRRRGSSLFQVDGNSLLDILGDANLPFLLPTTPKSLPSSTPPQSCHFTAVAEQCENHPEPPPHAPSASSSVSEAILSSNSKVLYAAAAESFERWNSQPTSFPPPTFFFTGEPSPCIHKHQSHVFRPH